MEIYKKKTNTGDDVYVRIQPNSSRPSSSVPPTAVVLGWLASKPKIVAKYTALYEQMGYNTVQTTAPFSVVFPVTPRVTAKFLLSILRILTSDTRLTDGGIVFHMFSNAGAVNAPHLARMFAGDYRDFIKVDDEIVVKKIKDSIAAVIFDSAPVYIRIHLGACAITEGLGFKESSVVGVIITIMFTILCLLQRLLINLPRDFWNDIRNAQYMCPELYIFSQIDHLLDVTALEDLIAERRQTGHDVRVWSVTDADHVSILRKHPSLYRRTIYSVNEWGVNVWRKNVSLSPWILSSDS